MNDRFSAQLRQHLLATANERPADGQLPALDKRLKVTSQRPSIVARLGWFPRRMGPFPSAAVRYGLIAVAMIIAIVGAALAAGFGPARSTVFEGAWTSTDVPDGSTQTLVVGPGTDPAVHFVDDFATGAACVADEVKVFTMDGTGTIVDDRLVVVWPDGGGCGLMKVEVGPGSYTYDQATDTIADGQELTWTRVQGLVVPPSRSPVTEPTAGPTRLPVAPDCVDLVNGGVYALRLGSTLVSDGALRGTMTVPAAPLMPWQGSRDQFELSSVCQSGSPIDIRATIVKTVYADGCDTGGSGVAVRSYADAVAQFVAQRGHTTEEVTGAARTIGGFPARMFAIDFDSGACGAIDLWNGANLVDGSALAYLVDVDGVALGILLRFPADASLSLNQRDEAETIVHSLQVDTGLGPEATDPIALPECTQFDGEATYTVNVGSLRLSVTVPGTPEAPWQAGPGYFGLRKAKCGPDGVGLPLIGAAVVDQVYADACHWKGAVVQTPTASDVVAALQVQQGHDTVGPIETTLGPYAATRFDFSVPQGFDRGSCDRDGLPWVKIWGDEILVSGGTKRVYVADVNGMPLIVTVGYYPDEITATGLDEIDAILASLRVGS